MGTLLRRRWAIVLVAAVVFGAAGRAWGIGFVLSETKEELKLKYDVEVQDHGTGRVTIVFALADEGRMAPLDEVGFSIPAQQKNPDGSNWSDLSVTIEMQKSAGGARVGRVHILKELAERGELWLNTHTMDGQLDPFTRLHHVIPIAPYLKAAAPPAAR